MTFDREVVWHEKDSEGKRTGRTLAVLWVGDDRYFGISLCSDKDNFSKKMGRAIAVGRAVHIYKVRSGITHMRGTRMYYDKRGMWAFSESTKEFPPTKLTSVPSWMYEDQRRVTNV